MLAIALLTSTALAGWKRMTYGKCEQILGGEYDIAGKPTESSMSYLRSEIKDACMAEPACGAIMRSKFYWSAELKQYVEKKDSGCTENPTADICKNYYMCSGSGKTYNRGFYHMEKEGGARGVQDRLSRAISELRALYDEDLERSAPFYYNAPNARYMTTDTVEERTCHKVGVGADFNTCNGCLKAGSGDQCVYDQNTGSCEYGYTMGIDVNPVYDGDDCPGNPCEKSLACGECTANAGCVYITGYGCKNVHVQSFLEMFKSDFTFTDVKSAGQC